ncbi:Hsp33 family molecular chaperone HslO [Ammoniphilus sp. CFH 90114]|uniref:Hsp33 family molecular chaperone HslO n=1 Tax=Ammoniphilus sp. CFH 90114 TaxID=2493665 RepID=UPI00100F3006|nr:Hsp33 family molecular chaperone HslO [Ammoniphilus sp. CFH 90114]RXT09023.1 Hsp33 family molecular chaperone HslO [Ammoniphilus sp. CFH 90114]
MKDYLVRAISRNGKVRAFAIRSTGVVEESRRRLDTWPVASAALGRSISASAMMGAMLKGNERLTVIIKGGGPIGQIVVDANGKGEVRGYVTNPHIHFPLNAMGKLDVAKAVGTDGQLLVTKDLGLKEPYNGSVELISGELGEDFTYYFAKSEQTPSAVSVGVLVNPDNSIKAAGGFIIQLLPGLSEADIAELEKKLSGIPPVSTMVDEGLTPEEILYAVLGKDDVEILADLDIVFSCHCSVERMENALISLGAEEIKSIIEEQGKAELTCHFCNEVYQVDQPELERLMKLAKK